MVNGVTQDFIDSFKDETSFDSVLFDLLIDYGEVPEGLDMLNPDVERIFDRAKEERSNARERGNG
jgi:hypothetical protein